MSGLDRAVVEMKRMADYLMPFVKTKEDEADLAPLRQRTVTIDGYDIHLTFNKEHHAHFDADSDERVEFDLLSLQVYSKYFPFLPFHLLCTLAVKFLGERELGLSEFVVMGRKVYIWSVAIDGDGKPVPVPLHPKVATCCYEGVEYNQAPTTQIVTPPVLN